MKKIFLGILFLLIPTTAWGSELKEAGETLTRDSMVFALEEAQKMQLYISKLEQEAQIKNEIIAAQKSLVENKNEQVLTFEKYLEIKNSEITIYKDLSETHKEYIKKLERKNNFKKLEVIGSFAGGALLTTTLLILADQIDDKVIE